MVSIVKSAIVDAPIDRVWGVLRDFNGHDQWHPEVATSFIEDGKPSDTIGCVRNFKLKNGAALREQLLSLSDRDHSFSYCLLDTPIPLLNYVAHVTLKPVTDTGATFWLWTSRFTTPKGRERELHDMVAETIYQGGIEAVRRVVARRFQDTGRRR